jgi:hypothetical protein
MSDHQSLSDTADTVESDIQPHLFDPVGLMYSKIDSHTNQPFARDFITLRWYEQQGLKYFYYKAFIHGWMRSTGHSNSYYLPAIAWVATVHLYARSVGVIMVGWWRDYWLLRCLTADHEARSLE